MALTPIPLGKNWAETFGSQFAPEATAVKLVGPVFTASFDEATSTLTVTPEEACRIDWGDNTAIEAVAADVATPHVYVDNGAYRIRVMDDVYDDLYVDYTFRMALTLVCSLSAVAGVPANSVALTIVNPQYPLTVFWGDTLPNDYIPFYAGPILHTYGSTGAKTIRVFDSMAKNTTLAVTIPIV